MANASLGPDGLITREGIISPLMYINRPYGTAWNNSSGYDDLVSGDILSLKDHPSSGLTAMFHGGLSPRTAPDESITWSHLRVIFRATRAGNSYTTETVNFKLSKYYYIEGWTDATSAFAFNNMDSDRGARTLVSPWLSQSSLGTDVPGIGIKIHSTASGGTVRIGAAYIQFKYEA